MPEQDPVESVRRLPPREKRKADPQGPEPAAQEPAPATEAAKRPERPPPKRRARPAPRHQGGVAEVRDVDFPVVFRGYDRAVVDAYVAKVSQLVAELEATQLREGVVQRALDEVGEQTSGILQHAHDTAEEITSSSRSQAEGRLQRAEREAAEIRKDAERFAQEVQADTSRLREERMGLIEEIRRFADEVLGVADEALDRLPEPAGERAEPEATETVDGDSPADVEDATRELPRRGDSAPES
jgi:DivIVA domain-containing protein